jgi:chromosome segregation protein
MRLERLEINGFKSFSDRSELSFDRGVTAIVGPNGCGKSNVADAITWVMGEQSAKSLRGERMEDVIFNGSDARKPTATAEVRLRFSGVLKNVMGPSFPDEPAAGVDGGEHAEASRNGHGESPNGYAINRHGSNGHAGTNGNSSGYGNGHAAASSAADALIQSVAREVEVTRRLYRSGDSEYLIDGQLCRLRDVHDLLMDTGLGAKAYAIIEQGKIGLILSSRPTDRRQLIEEAAGITKYKARRRAAELKLEAAQANLTRIEDIVFEVDKQRGTLKRQAVKAKRYRKLRDELRRWEKILFARKYRQLAETIESARGRLAEAREREWVSADRVSAIESELGRVRVQLVEAESHAVAVRERAHGHELAINRRQQQVAFDREQIQSLDSRRTILTAEFDTLDARREPARLALQAGREAAAGAVAERDRAEQALTEGSDAYEVAHREIEGLEADVEAARSEVFSAINSATALRHALEHARAARDRVAEALSKLDVERHDIRVESDRAETDRAECTERLRQLHEAMEATRVARTARESELASARIELEWRARSIRAREQEVAALEARLASLAELDAARAGFGDGARAVLAEANGHVGQQGAVADYLEVDPGYERAVEACLGDLVQHVVVERSAQAAAGLHLLRERAAGRCGFVVTSAVQPDAAFSRIAPGVGFAPPAGVVALSSVVRVNGPFDEAIRLAIGEAWIANTYEHASEASRFVSIPVATLAGDVFHGPHVVQGGGGEDARGILVTKREIKELRDRIDAERRELAGLTEEASALECVVAQASAAIASLNAEQHKEEKAVVAIEGQLQRAAGEGVRLSQKSEQLVREHRQATEEREALDRRQEEAVLAIGRLEHEQRSADERFALAQHRLFGAREAAEELSQRAADARAVHAGLVERATALQADVRRLEESSVELERRAAALGEEIDAMQARAAGLREAVAASEAQLGVDTLALEDLQRDVRAADEAIATLRMACDEQEGLVKEGRIVLEASRTVVSDLAIALATAEADLSHLAASCHEAVQATLDEVAAEVDQLERVGEAAPAASAAAGDEGEESLDEFADAFVTAGEPGRQDESAPFASDLSNPGEAVLAAERRSLGAEEAIAALREKIERLGPVNMMAIEQFDELEIRHAFLSTQHKDLVEAIAQTSEAIKRIDQTTRQRFSDAFASINQNFQQTFATLFGGGRAGLTLLDENDPLESGIEIIAQPPGKRLQSVQLLSGGEKALTAIALMFGLFQHKPSPFCLLDEIDAPLDDANIGRFVEMLRGMQSHTQFILITHNRKTMEIADRLYGVTMEEPGVSKLISVNLN